MPLDGLQDGRYRNLRLLGSGGMGDVYLMEDTRVDRRVAIKVIRSEAAPYPDSSVEKDAARLFQREARAVAALDHPNILPLFDFGEELRGNTILTYMVMPFCPDGSLSDWIRTHNGSTLLAPPDVAYLISQVADALQYAHDKHIIHLDVKLPNLLVRGNTRNVNRPTVLLTDFGVARFNAATASESRTIRGTPTSMAPEQWSGNPVPATDQYALAVMAFTLLTGRPPFLGSLEQLMYQHFQVAPPALQQFNAQLPASLNMVLQRALAKKPEDRFPSVADFSDALQQAVTASAAQSPALSTASDLRATLAISKSEALDGSERTLTLPGGKRVVVNIPAGSYDGQVLRLQNLKDATSGRTSDDILVLTLQVALEENSASLPNQGSMDPTMRAAPPTVQSSSYSGLATPQTPANPVATPYEVAGAGAANAVPYYQQSSAPMPPAGGQVPPTQYGYQNQPFIPPPPPPEIRPRRGRGRIWLLVVVAFVILASIGGFFEMRDQARIAAMHANATALANTQATATALVNTHATATTVAMNFNPYAPGTGSLVLDAPLTSNAGTSNWDEGTDNSGGVCSFKNSSYDVNETNVHFFASCTAANTDYADFAFEVQMKIIKGDSGGLIFRIGSTNNLSYEFASSKDGNCWLYVNTANNAPKQLTAATCHNFKQGLNQVNTIGVLAQGSTIKLFVNRQMVTTVTDGTYSHGKIGFVADPYNGSGKQVATEVVYNNAKVWKL